MKEAEELAHGLLMQGKAKQVDVIPSAYTMSLNPQGGVHKSTSVLVVAHGEEGAGAGVGAGDASVTGQEKEVVGSSAGQQQQQESDIEKLWWSSGMLKARAEARNQYDEEIIMAGGDPFFFTDNEGEQGEGKEGKRTDESQDDDDDDGPEDLDDLAHSSLLGW